jgi:hypothetical protein
MKLQFCLYFLFFGCLQLSAQKFGAEQYAANYMKTVSDYAALYSGNWPQPLGFRAQNNQFFKEQDYVSGKLSYNGIVYPNVLIRWDLFRDELVVLSPSNSNIVLINENVDFAEIHGFHIFYLHPDGLAGCPPAGNYILLNSDKYLLLEKLANTPYLSNVDSKKYIYIFMLSSYFFLQKDDVYYKIYNSRKLLKALGTHRKEMKRFIHTNKYKYKRDAEKMVLEVVKEHEKLSRYD